MNRPQALIFILFLIIQLNYVYSVCTKRNVATVINVDVGNIDLFCNPDEWFHGRINNHIRLKNFCGCNGQFDHDVYCNVEGEVETLLDCSHVMELPAPSPRLMEIRRLEAKQQEEKSKLHERERRRVEIQRKAHQEAGYKHMNEQKIKEKTYKKHLEEEAKRHARYEEDEKNFIAEARKNENFVEDFLKDDDGEKASNNDNNNNNDDNDDDDDAPKKSEESNHENQL